MAQFGKTASQFSVLIFALDRLSRYEYTLWRQVAQILFALDNLNRRKPQERKSSRFDYRQGESSPYAPNDD
jgi:hypothetical protein